MSKSTLTNEQISELIQGIKNGDKNAAKELISNYSDSIYFRVKMLNSDKEQAHKAYLAVCNSIVRNIASNEPETKQFDKWIDSYIDEFLFSAALPVEAEASSYDYTSADDTVDQSIQLVDDEEKLRLGVLRAVKYLTTSEAAAMVAHHYDHLSIEETAAKLNVSESDVTGLLANAKKAMHENQISFATVVAAMNMLNPMQVQKEEPVPAAPVIVPADEEPKPTSKGSLKWLLLGFAAILICVGLFIVSGLNRKSTADQPGKTDSSQNISASDNQDASASDASDTSDESGEKPKSSGIVGLQVEDEVVETLESIPHDQESPDSKPADPDTQSASGSEGSSESHSDEDIDPSDEPVDLGDGYVLGGF